MKTESLDQEQGKDNLGMDVKEPKEIFIHTKTTDDLVLDSKEEMDNLRERLKTVKYDEKLAKFYTTFTNEFEDLTGL